MFRKTEHNQTKKSASMISMLLWGRPWTHGQDSTGMPEPGPITHTGHPVHSSKTPHTRLHGLRTVSVRAG